MSTKKRVNVQSPCHTSFQHITVLSSDESVDMSLASRGLDSLILSSANSDKGSDSPLAAPVLHHPSAGRGSIAQGWGGATTLLLYEVISWQTVPEGIWAMMQ
jgi:hypothetical protein